MHSLHEALCSIPSNAQVKHGGTHICSPSTSKVKAEGWGVKGHSWVHSHSKINLGYTCWGGANIDNDIIARKGFQGETGTVMWTCFVHVPDKKSRILPEEVTWAPDNQFSRPGGCMCLSIACWGLRWVHAHALESSACSHWQLLLRYLRYRWMRFQESGLPFQSKMCEHIWKLLLQMSHWVWIEICQSPVWLCR